MDLTTLQIKEKFDMINMFHIKCFNVKAWVLNRLETLATIDQGMRK